MGARPVHSHRCRARSVRRWHSARGVGDAVITLPYPPTVNHYWTHDHRVSQRGKSFRLETMVMCRQARVRKHHGRLALVVRVFPPDHRQRDLDNVLKALLDALAHSGVYDDDGQIDALVVLRMPPCKGGKVEVQVKERGECPLDSYDLRFITG